jgi:molybdopterin-guanine dinucleotide biosynthesis protein MobB
MQAVVIAGPKKSGKTTILALVAEALERLGKTVAVVKYSNHTLEKGNADAFWLMRPNRAVVNVSPEETVAFWPEQLSFESVISHLKADVVLFEGGEAPVSVPRVLCFKEGEGMDKTCLACKEGGYDVLASFGASCPGSDAPFFAEMEPLVAEKVASLILEKSSKI